MKHASTRALFAYWNEKRGNRPAPEREDIDPTAIRHALGDTFMLAADFVNEQRFRLAGTRICALFCRELKGETFAGLWSQSSRAQITELLSAMTSETVGAVAGLTGRGDNGAQVDLELLILPLAHRGLGRIRALGALSPVEIPYWIGTSPVIELELGVLRHIGQDVESIVAPRFGLVPESSRLRHGFIVYKGGRGEVPPRSGRTG
ncbi:MAG: PAS domain-containing protein [Pseudolabrys sp.]